MPPILHPITEYRTVQQYLVTSMEVSQKLLQPYTFVTMDLATAKIAYDIKWDKSEQFSKVIVHLGGFYIIYMGTLGKIMTGSGFEEVVILAGICASGSLDKVMSGKHYNRTMRVHQLMLDACERLLLQEFLVNTGFSNSQFISGAECIGRQSSARCISRCVKQ